jgi:hypothetical protein
VPTPVVPRSTDVQEYQWSSELVDELSALPRRSTFVGKFSIVSDPAVDNSKGAFTFADQLRARGLFISCVTTLPTNLTLTHVTLTLIRPSRVYRKSSKSTSCNMDGGNAFMLLFSCACQPACGGQVVISADDDKSHPSGIPGQRLGVAILHPSS